MSVRSTVRPGLRPALLIMLGTVIASGLTPAQSATSASNTLHKAAPAAPAQRSPRIGDPLSDSATISGGFYPTGTITFTIYGPNDPSCSGTGTVVGAPVAVNGNDTYRTTTPYFPTAGGTYDWIARYSGDVNNKPSADPCGSEQVKIHPNHVTCPTGVVNIGNGNSGVGDFGNGNEGSCDVGNGNEGSGQIGDGSERSRRFGDDSFGDD